MADDRAVWHMPRTSPPTIYLTFDDGPNPSTTPDLLDVLAREQAHATFFLIDRHVTEETAPIVRRMFAEGHVVALHTASRADMLWSASEVAQRLMAAAGRIESLAGSRPCHAFRPHAGWRTGRMYSGLRQIDYKLVGWGWMRRRRARISVRWSRPRRGWFPRYARADFRLAPCAVPGPPTAESDREPVSAVSERPKEVQQILFLIFIELVEIADDAVAFGAGAAMRPDRGDQVRCPSVVKEEEPLPESP